MKVVGSHCIYTYYIIPFLFEECANLIGRFANRRFDQTCNAPGLRGGKWCEIMPELCFSVQHGFGFGRKSCGFPPNMNEFANFWKNSCDEIIKCVCVCVIFEPILLKTWKVFTLLPFSPKPPSQFRCSPCKGLRSWFVELRWGKHSNGSPLWWVKRLSVGGPIHGNFHGKSLKKTVSISKDQRWGKVR